MGGYTEPILAAAFSQVSRQTFRRAPARHSRMRQSVQDCHIGGSSTRETISRFLSSGLVSDANPLCMRLPGKHSDWNPLFVSSVEHFSILGPVHVAC